MTERSFGNDQSRRLVFGSPEANRLASLARSVERVETEGERLVPMKECVRCWGYFYPHYEGDKRRGKWVCGTCNDDLEDGRGWEL